MQRHGKWLALAAAAFGLPAVAGAQQIVNIDFEGQRAGDAGTAGLFVGQGAAGGGTVFNGIAADSTVAGDNITVSGTNLLDSNGAATTVGFSISPVGGDNEPANAIQPDSLYDDYVFNNSAGNQVGAAGSPFTISGLTTPAADLYLYFSFDAGRAGGTTVNGAADPDGTLGTFNGFSNVLFFDDVPVSGGSITGTFGVSNTGVLGGLTIAPVPEPAGLSLLALGGLGLLAHRRRR